MRVSTVRLEFVYLCNQGVYGDVIRVKIMFNKKDTALIQFSDPSHAQVGEII